MDLGRNPGGAPGAVCSSSKGFPGIILGVLQRGMLRGRGWMCYPWTRSLQPLEFPQRIWTDVGKAGKHQITPEHGKITAQSNAPAAACPPGTSHILPEDAWQEKASPGRILGAFQAAKRRKGVKKIVSRDKTHAQPLVCAPGSIFLEWSYTESGRSHYIEAQERPDTSC